MTRLRPGSDQVPTRFRPGSDQVPTRFRPGSDQVPTSSLGTRTELCLGHGCSSHRILVEHERNYGSDWMLLSPYSLETNGIMVWAWMLQSPYSLGTRTESWFGHGCSSYCILLEHERNCGLGMDAPVTVFSPNTNRSMVWTKCSSHRILLKRTELWLGQMIFVTVFSWNTNGIMVGAWMP